MSTHNRFFSGWYALLIAAALLMSCGEQRVRLFEAESAEEKEQALVAWVRGAPRAIIHSINGQIIDDRAAERNDYHGPHCRKGIWYELPPGEYTIDVGYAGFFSHSNPEYFYLVRPGNGHPSRGPLLQKGRSAVTVDMISSDRRTLTVTLGYGKKYEIRTRLVNSADRPFIPDGLPRLVAPRDTTVLIVADTGNAPTAILPVPRASAVRVADIRWDAYIVEVGSTADAEDRRPENLPLARAIEAGQDQFARYLMASGEDLDGIFKAGLTPLHHSAADGQTALVRLLLTNGADVNARNDYGMTPLHLAAGNGHVGVVRMLLKGGAHINALNDMGGTALFYAAGNGHLGAVRELIARGARVTTRQVNDWAPLHHAAQGGFTDIVRLLIAHGAGIHERTDLGLTALMIAVNEDHLEAARVLLDAGIDPDQRDYEGWTAVHLAALNGNDEMLEMLLDNGASPCLPNHRRCTPLHNAALNGDTLVIGVLLDAGCDVNAATRNGWTPLHLAASGGNEHTIVYLMDHGADIRARTEDGMSARYIAKRKGDAVCTDLLHRYERSLE